MPDETCSTWWNRAVTKSGPRAWHLFSDCGHGWTWCGRTLAARCPWDRSDELPTEGTICPNCRASFKAGLIHDHDGALLRGDG